MQNLLNKPMLMITVQTCESVMAAAISKVITIQR